MASSSADWAEHASVNRIEAGTDYKMGIITSSTSYQYVKEACGGVYPVLKLGMVWPLPEEKIRRFAGLVDLLVTPWEWEIRVHIFMNTGVSKVSESS